MTRPAALAIRLASRPGCVPSPASRASEPLGVVAIDLQQVFFDTASSRNPTSGIAQRMAWSAHVFELAGANHVPVIMTFDATKTGDHALPPPRFWGVTSS